MKEYTLFEAVQKLVQCINGQQIKITSVDKEEETSLTPDIRCFGVNVFHKHKTNGLYTITDVNIYNNNNSSDIIDIRSLSVLAPYFKVKPIAMSKFAQDGDNNNHAISDEVITTEWIDMPANLLSGWTNMTDDDSNYHCVIISYDLTSYLDYVNFNGLLAIADEAAEICYILGFDVNCFKDQSIVDTLNLSPMNKLGLPIYVECLSNDDNNLTNFVVMGNSKFFAVFPANDGMNADTDLAILPISQQSSATDGDMMMSCIPDVDLKIVGVTYKYTVSSVVGDEPAILAP